MVVSSLKSLFCVVSTKPPGSVQQSWYPVWQSPLVLVQRVLRLRTPHLPLLNSMKFPCVRPSSLPGVTSPSLALSADSLRCSSTSSRQPEWAEPRWVPGEALEGPCGAPRPSPDGSLQEQFCSTPGWLYLEISLLAHRADFSWASAASCLLVPHQLVI